MVMWLFRGGNGCMVNGNNGGYIASKMVKITWLQQLYLSYAINNGFGAVGNV